MADWRIWRQEERRRQIAARKALTMAVCRSRNAAIDAALAHAFSAVGGHVVGFCWPIANEPEPRFAVRRWRDAGSRAALPVVVAPREPLVFREWWPGAPMQKGVYDIPFPVGTPVRVPEVALVPVNAFDAGGYRLGYGGGYFDRTLAALPTRPLCIGLGYEAQHVASIRPQPHDIPFDFIVTEAAIRVRIEGVLQVVDAGAAARHVAQRLQSMKKTGSPASR